MIPSIGPLELVVVLAIALIILGPKRLPDAGKSLGRGMREFKDSLTGGGSADTDAPRLEESRERVAARAE
jgi:sec-independent protein translocase protein TatA